MQETQETVALTRDVVAALVPSGQKVEQTEGAKATVTQALGSSFTVLVEGHMFRIEGKDADVIGREPPAMVEIPAEASDEDVEKACWAQLKTCYDPEIPIDIVELGLIYECRLDKQDDGSRRASVQMTLTAPGCGMGDFLVNDVRSKLLEVPTVEDAEVELTFDPPWTREMMSETAQLALGMF